MKNKKWIIPAVLLIAVIACAWLIMSLLTGDEAPTEPDVPSQPEKTAAPDFEMTDAEGNVVKLSDFKGKPVVLNFWASWCGPCKAEMPHFQAAYDAQGEEVVFIMLNMLADTRETPEKAATFIADGGYTFPVYSDSDNQAAAAYGVTSIPRTYTIDVDGNLVDSYPGTLDEARLNGLIEALLAA